MSSGDDMSLEVIELQSGKNPTASLVVLHGLGADGTDFVPIAQELRLDPVGEVRFLFPHAPVMPVTINGGMRMRAWYDIIGTEISRREDERGLRSSQALVESLTARGRERGIPPGRIVLMGFSQDVGDVATGALIIAAGTLGLLARRAASRRLGTLG